MEMTDNLIFIHGQASLEVKKNIKSNFTPFLLYMIIGIIFSNSIHFKFMAGFCNH